MDPREDEDPPFDDNDDNDPVIRELRAEMVRLQAELDQLSAAVRERAEESAELRARLDELERVIERIRLRMRRSRIWVAIGVVYGVSLGMWIGYLLHG